MGMGKRPVQDPDDILCQRIAEWMYTGLEVMRCPPAEVYVKKGRVKDSEGEEFTAEIEVERGYNQIKVTVDPKRFRKKTVRQQHLCMTHELGHYVMHMFDKHLQSYLDSLYRLIPGAVLNTPPLEALEQDMEDEREKLVDHIAFLALHKMPKWTGA